MVDSELIYKANQSLMAEGLETFFEACNKSIHRLVDSSEYQPILNQISTHFNLSPKDCKEVVIATMSIGGIACMSACGAIVAEVGAIAIGSIIYAINPIAGIAVSGCISALAGIAGTIG